MVLSVDASSVELDKYEIWSGFKQLLPISMFVVVFAIAFGLAAGQLGNADGDDDAGRLRTSDGAGREPGPGYPHAVVDLVV